MKEALAGIKTKQTKNKKKKQWIAAFPLWSLQKRMPRESDEKTT